MSELVFVYGALRRGASDDWRMRAGKFLREGVVGGVLVKVDWYPGFILGGEGRVKGEVFEVSDQLLSELDEFEGVDRNDEYRRVLVDCGGEKVWVYEWLKGAEGYELVESGDWLSVSSDR